MARRRLVSALARLAGPGQTSSAHVGASGKFHYGPVDGSWFSVSPPADREELSAADLEFAGALARAAAGWDLSGIDIPDADTWVQTWEDDDDAIGVLAGLQFLGRDGFQDPIFAAAMVGGRLHCGPIHPDITYFVSPWSAGLALDAEGTPAELAQRASVWLHGLLTRPVVLFLWRERERFYAGRYEYADNGDLLGEWIDPAHGPDTRDLPTPDAYVFVRGDRSAALVPDGARELTRAKPRDLLGSPGSWLRCDARNR